MTTASTLESVQTDSEPTTHTLHCFAANKAEILARMALVLHRRNFTIHSFRKLPTQNPDIQKMILEVEGEFSSLPSTLKLLNKLIDIIQIITIYPKENDCHETCH